MPKASSILRKRAARAAALATAVLLAPPFVAGALPANAQGDTDFTFMLQRQPKSFSGSYLAGRLAGSEGDAPSAAEFYRDALAADPNSLSLLDRAFVLSLVAGDQKDAMDLAARVLDRDQTHLLSRLALAVEHVQAGRMDEAEALLEDPGQGPLAELTTTLLDGWVAQGLGETDKAISAIEGLEGPDWYSVFKPYHVGLIAELAGREDKAGEALEEAYTADPGALRTVQAWARHLAAVGRKDDALGVLDEIDSRLADHPLIVRMRETIAAGEVPEPVVSSAAQGVAELFYGLGSALGSDSAEEYAASYLQLALALDPANDLARFALADFFERLKDHEAAAATYAAVPQDSPLFDSAEVRRALVLSAGEQTEDAKEILRGVLEREPDSMDALVALGNILRMEQDFAEAVNVYTQALDVAEQEGEERWTLYYFRGIANERTKNWEQAESDLQTALEIEPGQPLVLNYLGYSWIDQGLNLEEGLEMIQRAVDARPNDGFIVDSLGWAYYRLGQYDKAVEHLERAVELMPQEGVINDHLGDAYWQIGRKLEAKFQWNHALDLDLSEEPGLEKDIRAKLEHGLTGEQEPAAVVSETE